MKAGLNVAEEEPRRDLFAIVSQSQVGSEGGPRTAVFYPCARWTGGLLLSRGCSARVFGKGLILLSDMVLGTRSRCRGYVRDRTVTVDPLNFKCALNTKSV